MGLKKFVIIEQGGDGEAYITHIKAQNEDDAFERYTAVDSAQIVVLNEQAYYNMCLMGMGA